MPSLLAGRRTVDDGEADYAHFLLRSTRVHFTAEHRRIAKSQFRLEILIEKRFFFAGLFAELLCVCPERPLSL